MDDLSRRAFTQQMLGSLFTFLLIKTVCRGNSLAEPVKQVADHWLRETEEVSRAVKEHQIDPTEWQRKIEEFYTRVDLPDFLRAIDFERLSKTAKFRDDHESNRPIDTSHLAGTSSELSFDPIFVALKKGCAVVPHAHRNLTSMHMVLAGQIHARSYERISDDGQHLVIQPAIDQTYRPGDLSTVSDKRHNVHWFKGLSETAFMFNIGVLPIDPKIEFSGREYIDPLGGEKLRDGMIRVRRIEAEEAFRLYGKT